MMSGSYDIPEGPMPNLVMVTYKKRFDVQKEVNMQDNRILSDPIELLDIYIYYIQ